MDHIRLWGVHWHGTMANILRREKDTESESVKEVSSRKETRYWSECETGALTNEVTKILELRDHARTVYSCFSQLRQCLVVFLTCQSWIQRGKLVIYTFPGFDFGISVRDPRNVLPRSILLCDLSDFLPAFSIYRVSEPRMIGFKLHPSS
jgi:hypothetical protein